MALRIETARIVASVAAAFFFAAVAVSAAVPVLPIA